MLAYRCICETTARALFSIRFVRVVCHFGTAIVLSTLHKPIECLQHFAKGESSSGGFGCYDEPNFSLGLASKGDEPETLAVVGPAWSPTVYRFLAIAAISTAMGHGVPDRTSRILALVLLPKATNPKR